MRLMRWPFSPIGPATGDKHGRGGQDRLTNLVPGGGRAYRKIREANGRKAIWCSSFGNLKIPGMTARLAKQLEKLVLVRTRVRKGKDWLKAEITEEGDLVIGTKSITWNSAILSALLATYGLEVKIIPELTKEALGLNLFHHVAGYRVPRW